ncbi:MAG: hypothetical protein Q8L02_00795 [Candidatus Nitrotoga sp.]|nr:hypothetical protein [Candidatus Nitrotoga sp.]
MRRVDANSISVFIALRFKRSITMNVFACDNKGAPTTLSLGHSTFETRRFGQRLHVAVITVTGLTLKPLQLYAYDLSFQKTSNDDAEDTGPTDSSLQSLGLLSGATSLGYEEGYKPTFRMPSDQANSLEFIHASCRKLHGEGKDAFPHIDEIIKELRLSEFKRPQMMFLTGDQIYADDVAGPLSSVLAEIANALLGWAEEEKIPTSYGDAPISTCWPGLRNLIVKADFKAENEASACHLLGLGEYYAMYLMAWSDAVWPENLPDPTVIYPGEVFKNGQGRRDPLGGKNSSSFYEDVLSHASTFIGDGTNWKDQVSELGRIKASLPAVRRLMANVPIFMMFDDHEITDDWNFDRDWHERVYGSILGRRIIGNGLSAYAIFQGWGNDPLGEFATNKPGNQLLSALEIIGRLNGATYNESNETYKLARTLMRVIPESTVIGVTWDYSFELGDYRVIALDTRTRRDITHEGQIDLMPISELDRQITNRTITTKTLSLILSPAPVIGLPFHERILLETAGERFSKVVDREPWWTSKRPEAFEALLDRLSLLERVIILTGDVHFASTSTIRYWNDRPGRVARAAIVQLCSSGLKNEDWKHRMLGNAGRTDISANSIVGYAVVPPEREEYVGWMTGPVIFTPTRGIIKWNTAPNVSTKSPIIHRLEVDSIDYTSNKVPSWRYRLGFSVDLRNQRGYQLAAPEKAPSNEGYLAKRIRLGQEQRISIKNNSNLILVGYNNFGRVSVFGTQPHLGVFHKLWFRSEGQLIHPYTIHFADLDNPNNSEAPPFSPTRPEVGLPDLSAWADLISFRPEYTQQNKLHQLNIQNPGKWFFHRLDSCWGKINLDYYSVKIHPMPRSLPDDPSGLVRTGPVTIEELFQYVRRKLLVEDAVVNSLLTKFRPYGSTDETAWLGSVSDALGALISIRIPLNEGTVMVTQVDSTSWTFSTLNSPADNSHPVCGNRRFGIFLAEDGKIHIYTMGADRCTDLLIATTPAVEGVWFGADKVWRSFQENIVELVKKHDGYAEIITPISRRYDWSIVASAYFSPKNDWQN